MDRGGISYSWSWVCLCHHQLAGSLAAVSESLSCRSIGGEFWIIESSLGSSPRLPGTPSLLLACSDGKLQLPHLVQALIGSWSFLGVPSVHRGASRWRCTGVPCAGCAGMDKEASITSQCTGGHWCVPHSCSVWYHQRASIK